MNSTMNGRLPGTLVISLDFELHWGVRDKQPAMGPYRRNLLGARDAVPPLLQLFADYGIAATWATVGFLFASSRSELERFSPRRRPQYATPGLSPYGEALGEDEEQDPLHFAPSLIAAVRRTPRQELATHTFSHYYCLEAGQDRETFRADLEAARAIAAQQGVRLLSIVFPRNQHNPAYDVVLQQAGIRAYRANPRSWLYRGGDTRSSGNPLKRAGRLLDAYFPLTGNNTVAWSDVLQPSGLSNVAASGFLRPVRAGAEIEARVRLARIHRSMREAARSGRIFHLWWHPHNIGAHITENLGFLRGILDEFSRCRESYGMDSLSMYEVDRLARGEVDYREEGKKPHPGTGTVPLHG